MEMGTWICRERVVYMDYAGCISPALGELGCSLVWRFPHAGVNSVLHY